MPSRSHYVATSPTRYLDDAQWRARVDKHRLSRPATWTTIEDVDVVSYLENGSGPTLVDDLGMWVTTCWDQDGEVRQDDLCRVVTGFDGHLVLVSPEVGMSVAPRTESGAWFRDALGSLNAAVASVCDEVYLVVAGIPVPLKAMRQ